MRTKKITVISKIKQPAMTRMYMNHVFQRLHAFLLCFVMTWNFLLAKSLFGSLVAQG